MGAGTQKESDSSDEKANGECRLPLNAVAMVTDVRVAGGDWDAVVQEILPYRGVVSLVFGQQSSNKSKGKEDATSWILTGQLGRGCCSLDAS